MLSNRVYWVDVAKALAIILVVIGHMGFPEEVRTVIYGFHMPLFFLLSGIFVSTKEDFRSFFAKKARTLLIPYLCFNAIFIAFDLAQSIIVGHNYSLGQFCDWYIVGA